MRELAGAEYFTRKSNLPLGCPKVSHVSVGTLSVMLLKLLSELSSGLSPKITLISGITKLRKSCPITLANFPDDASGLCLPPAERLGME